LDKKKELAFPPALSHVPKKRPKLEREMNSKFTPDRARDEGGIRSEESGRVAERGRAADIGSEIVPIICSVGQVECLRYQLNIYAFAESEVLG
jgi:hypothetical protein